jgi:hypothetical protein
MPNLRKVFITWGFLLDVAGKLLIIKTNSFKVFFLNKLAPKGIRGGFGT